MEQNEQQKHEQHLEQVAKATEEWMSAVGTLLDSVCETLGDATGYVPGWEVHFIDEDSDTLAWTTSDMAQGMEGAGTEQEEIKKLLSRLDRLGFAVMREADREAGHGA